MSTLTKTLIILLSVGAIFLSGIVVTYVGTATNYKEEYEKVKAQSSAAQQQQRQFKEQLNEQKQQFDVLQRDLQKNISSLQEENERLASEMENLRRENATLTNKVANWASVAEDFQKTNEKQGEMLNETLAKLDEVKSSNIQLEKEVEETTAELIQRMGIIESLRSEVRQLTEQKTELQGRLDKLLQPYGQTASEPAAVTPEPDRTATMRRRPSGSAAAEPISLSGVINDVDMSNNLASVSLGSADGVMEGMVFHVIRGSEFICDIRITDVEPETSVGVLELVQRQPQVGDTVSTNF